MTYVFRFGDWTSQSLSENMNGCLGISPSFPHHLEAFSGVRHTSNGGDWIRDCFSPQKSLHSGFLGEFFVICPDHSRGVSLHFC